MHPWQIIVVIVTLSQLTTMPSMNDTYSWREQYALETPNKELRGGGHLEIDGYSFKPSDRICFDLRFEDWRGHGTVYYQAPGGLRPSAVALAIYNEKHEYIGQYRNSSGSRAGVGSDCFVEVSDGEYLGKRIDWIAGAVVPVGYGMGDKLAPGTYFVQAIFFNAFIRVDSRTRQQYPPSESEAFMKHFDRTELFRSNTVEIRILPEQ